jgi:hypothetical protein
LAGRKQIRATLAAAAVLSAAVWVLFSCLPARPSFSPPPPQVKSVEGYASWRLTRAGETAKSRFSFVFVLPVQGRIDVIDPLGRTAAVLFFEAEEAFFVLPSKKVYWRTTREEAMSRFLGFTLSPPEMTDFLTGRLQNLNGWDLEKDGRSRVSRGRKGGLRFEIRQFFDDTPLPQLLVFSHGDDRGSMRILRLNFNQPLKENALRLSFLEAEDYRSVDWAEIEKLLRHED